MIFFAYLNRLFILLTVVSILFLSLLGRDINILAKSSYSTKSYDEMTVEQKRSLNSFILSIKNVSELEKVKRVNSYFNNSALYVEDYIAWGEEDYWSTPMEFINRNAGDCEDFSIAKYMILRASGVSADKLKISYVNLKDNGEILKHMVLNYYKNINSEPYILDNIDGELKLASSRKDIFPIFRFNENSLWIGNNLKSYSGVSSISKWMMVLNKTKKDSYFKKTIG